MEPLQVRIWSNKKKLATQKKTNITQIKEDQELNDVEMQTKETTEPQETLMVKRFKRIQKFDKFSKCPDCSRRLPGTCLFLFCFVCLFFHNAKLFYGESRTMLHGCVIAKVQIKIYVIL